MKTNTGLFVVQLIQLVAVGFILLLLMSRTYNRFEYELQFFHDTTDFVSKLDTWGNQGWEAVATRRATDRKDRVGYEILFKRAR